MTPLPRTAFIFPRDGWRAAKPAVRSENYRVVAFTTSSSPARIGMGGGEVLDPTEGARDRVDVRDTVRLFEARALTRSSKERVNALFVDEEGRAPSKGEKQSFSLVVTPSNATPSATGGQETGTQRRLRDEA